MGKVEALGTCSTENHAGVSDKFDFGQQLRAQRGGRRANYMVAELCVQPDYTQCRACRVSGASNYLGYIVSFFGNSVIYQ